MRSKPTDRYHWTWHRMLRRVAQRGPLRALIGLMVTVRVEGEENVADLDGPFILVANHSSHLDAPVLVSSLPYSLTKNLATAVAADYFYEQKWRSTLTSVFFNSYPVDREGRKSKRAGLSVSLLRQGVPLLIFPEGTRSRTGEMARFKPGAAALARALRVPVVAVALVGAHDAMPVGRNWPVLGRPEVLVLVGSPVRVRSGESLTDFNARVESRVVTMRMTGQVESDDAPLTDGGDDAPPSGSSDHSNTNHDHSNTDHDGRDHGERDHDGRDHGGHVGAGDDDRHQDGARHVSGRAGADAGSAERRGDQHENERPAGGHGGAEHPAHEGEDER